MIVIAAALGTFVIGRDHVPASSSLMQNPGMKLTASMSLSSKGELEIGKTLYVQTCSACHGVVGQGSPGVAPSLRGVGSAAVDLWLTAGWMPLRTPQSQPEGKPVYLTPSQIDALVAYVYSLDPTGYQIPTSIDLKNASTAQGFQVFSLNCAPCHTITGAGDALANGAKAPPLHGVTATMVLEAIRTGPANMPRFAPGDISNQEALDVVAFVTKNIEHPANIGGIGLGGVGPVAEGFVGLFVGVGVCLLAAYWVGDRTAREDEEHGHDGDAVALDGHGAGDGDDNAAGPDDAGHADASVGTTETADD